MTAKKTYSEITLRIQKSKTIEPYDCKALDRFVICQIKGTKETPLYLEITVTAKQICEVVDGLMLTHVADQLKGIPITDKPKETLNKKYKYLGLLQGFCPIWAKQ